MALRNAFGEIALEDTLKQVQRGAPDQDRRFDWQLVGGENKPLYIGVAPPGTLTSALTWQIERYTFAVGPAGTAVPTAIETRTGAWDDRTGLFA